MYDVFVEVVIQKSFPTGSGTFGTTNNKEENNSSTRIIISKKPNSVVGPGGKKRKKVFLLKVSSIANIMFVINKEIRRGGLPGTQWKSRHGWPKT